MQPPPIDIELRTTFADGHECVKRKPHGIHSHRKDVDVVTITNKNPLGTGSAITVTMDPGTLGNVFVNPPSAPQILDPGQSMTLTVKPVMASQQSEGFTTIPQSCQHHDAGDIIIEP
jgi:hypothetical protein